MVQMTMSKKLESSCNNTWNHILGNPNTQKWRTQTPLESYPLEIYPVFILLSPSISNVPTTQHDMKNNNIAVNFALELHHTLNKALTLCTKNNNIAVNFALELHHTLNKALTLCMKNNNIAVNFALELHHTLNKALTFCRHTFYLHYLRTNKSNKKTKQQIIQPIMT